MLRARLARDRRWVRRAHRSSPARGPVAACARIRGMRVLVAPDRFGSTLPATRAAAAIRDGWARAAPSDDVRVLPLSDGGPGLLAALLATVGGELLSVTVRSPWGADWGDDVPAAVLLATDDRGGRTA